MNLLGFLQDFYSSINRKEMYIRYVNKLCQLHVECDNYTEAGYALQLHSKLLSWTDDPLPPHLKSQRHPDRQTHLDLKEALYRDSIQYFAKGKVGVTNDVLKIRNGKDLNILYYICRCGNVHWICAMT